MNRKEQFENLINDIQTALKSVGFFDSSFINTFSHNLKKEVEILENNISETDWKLPVEKRLVLLAKMLRLCGELPYYTAKFLGFWFAYRKENTASSISSDSVKDAVQEYYGVKYEQELVRMIVDAFNDFPQFFLWEDQKVKLVKEAYRRGYYYEQNFRGCAQCHMAALSDVTGKEDLVMFRAANGFAAGMGLLGDGVCGGYSGGILSLGMFAGRRKEFFGGDREEKNLCTRLVGKLHTKYIETYGTVICHGIHKKIFGRAFHITNSRDKEEFEEAGAHKLDKCTAVVATSAAWVAEILFDEGFLP